MKYFFFQIQWRIGISYWQTCTCNVSHVILLFQFLIEKRYINVAWCLLEKLRQFQNKNYDISFPRDQYLGVLFLEPGDVRPIGPKTKFCSHFEAITVMRPGLIFLNWENHLKTFLFHLYWGVRSSRANFVFLKSAFKMFSISKIVKFF